LSRPKANVSHVWHLGFCRSHPCYHIKNMFNLQTISWWRLLLLLYIFSILFNSFIVYWWGYLG